MRIKITYACPASDFAADSHLLKLQRLQNIDLRTTGNVPRRTPTRALHRTFMMIHKKICRKQAEVIQTHHNVNVRNIDRNEAQLMKNKNLKLDDGQAYDRSGI